MRRAPYALDIGWWWLLGQLDLAGYPTHFVLTATVYDPAATIYWQLMAMGDRGF
jgi:hypothetical protein